MAKYDHIPDSRLKELANAHPEQAHVFEAMLAERAAKAAADFGIADTLAVAGQGAAMGWGDEALAALTTGGGLWGDYTETRDGYRRHLDQLQQNNPAAYMAAELAGGIGAGFIPGLNGLQAINRAKTLGQLAMNTGKVGAATGALSGAGYSESDGVGGLLTDTAIGMGTGAVLNSAIGTAVPAARTVLNRSRSSDQIIADIAAEHGITPDKVNARLREMGPEATLADAFPKLRETAYGSYGIGGFIEEQGSLTARNQEAGKRLLNDIEKETGRRQGDLRKETEHLQTQRKQTANAEYQVLDGRYVPFDDALPFLTSKTNSKQIKEVLDEWYDNTGQTIDSFEEAGAVPARLLQNLRAATSEEAADMAGKTKGTRAGALSNRANEIDSELRAIPGWDEAKNNYRIASEEIDNLGRGREGGKSPLNIDRDQGILEAVLADTPRNRDAYAVGAQQRIMDDILAAGGANDTGSVLSRLGNPRQQEIKFQGAGIPGFAKNVDRERAFNETFQLLGEGQGAKTNAGRTAKEVFEDESGVLSGALRAAADPTLVGLDAVTSMMKKTYGLKNKETAKAVLRRLLQRGLTPDEVAKILDTEQGAKRLAEFLQTGAKWTGRLGPSSVGVLQDART